MSVQIFGFEVAGLQGTPCIIIIYDAIPMLNVLQLGVIH